MKGSLIESREANYKECRLRSCPGAIVTLSCTNLFALSPEDRRFVLDILETMEKYEAAVEGGKDGE